MSKQQNHLSVEPLDVNDFIEKNKLKQITNPIFFSSNNTPTPDGLLSNEIFGISKDDRSNTFAYIHLGDEWFINPIFYKILRTLDSKIVDCVFGTKNFIIDKNGQLQVDEENGDTGLEFLHKNFNKLKFYDSDSLQRRANIKFVNKYRDRVFINNYIVIPAFYRDVSTTERYVGVGDVNKLYNSLLIYTNSIKEYDRYGISIYNSIKGKIQDKLVEIYDYFTKENISGKFGILHRAALSKTSDYSSRLVITAPNLKVENMDDLMADVDHSAIPLASVLANFYPCVLVYIRNFFMNNYINSVTTTIDVKGKPEVFRYKDWRIAFSDDVLKEELDRFIHGIADRFRVIKLPLEKNKFGIESGTMKFKGRLYSKKDIDEYKDNEESDIPDTVHFSLLDRKMTWCDLFYMAAVEVSRDKMALITRYPIDSCYNQFTTKINVSSTHETEPIVIDEVLYKHYPKIRKEDLDTNTTDKFIDSLNISNVYLGSIGGDYDGDQVTVKSVYSVEANDELRKNLNSVRHFISLGGTNIMETTNEGTMATYSLTMNLDKDKDLFTDPEF